MSVGVGVDEMDLYCPTCEIKQEDVPGNWIGRTFRGFCPDCEGDLDYEYEPDPDHDWDS